MGKFSRTKKHTPERIRDLVDWQEQVLNADVPVLVDFYANWCQPCRSLSGVVKELAEEFGERAKVVVVDIDDATDVAKAMRVKSVPTLLVYEAGTQRKRYTGLMDKQTLRTATLGRDA